MRDTHSPGTDIWDLNQMSVVQGTASMTQPLNLGLLITLGLALVGRSLKRPHALVQFWI